MAWDGLPKVWSIGFRNLYWHSENSLDSFTHLKLESKDCKHEVRMVTLAAEYISQQYQTCATG